MFPAVGTRDGVRKRRSPVLIINRGSLVTRERERERESVGLEIDSFIQN